MIALLAACLAAPPPGTDVLLGTDAGTWQRLGAHWRTFRPLLEAGGQSLVSVADQAISAVDDALMMLETRACRRPRPASPMQLWADFDDPERPVYALRVGPPVEVVAGGDCAAQGRSRVGDRLVSYAGSWAFAEEADGAWIVGSRRGVQRALRRPAPQGSFPTGVAHWALAVGGETALAVNLSSSTAVAMGRRWPGLKPLLARVRQGAVAWRGDGLRALGRTFGNTDRTALMGDIQDRMDAWIERAVPLAGPAALADAVRQKALDAAVMADEWGSLGLESRLGAWRTLDMTGRVWERADQTLELTLSCAASDALPALVWLSEDRRAP